MPITGASSFAGVLDALYAKDAGDVEPEPLGRDPLVHRLLQLLQLAPAWDGRRAPTPSSTAVRITLTALERAPEHVRAEEARVAADVEGGIATYFFGGPRLADGGWERQGGLLVSNDGEVTLYLRSRRARGEVVDSVDPAHLPEALDRIGRFLSDA
jgi:hypothetical protein